MDHRNERYGSRQGFMKSSGMNSRDSYTNPHNADLNKVAYDSYQMRKPESSSSPYSHPLRAPSYEEAHRIEQRHEELKRQIALKEKQLADMTGERETVNALRSKLGLKDLVPDESKASYSQSRRNIVNTDSAKRGGMLASSASPDHSMPSMVGLKSTTYGRGTSYEKTANNRNKFLEREDLNAREDLQAQKYASQQLQFNPTRIPAAVTRVQPRSNSSASPLRYKLNNNDESAAKNNYPISDQRYDYNDRSKFSSQPKFQDRTRVQNSPLRRQENSAIIEEPVESSEYQEESSPDKTLLKMQQVQPVLTQSGRPMIASIPQNAREKLYRERIEAMTLDNQSLQRRLNQVTSELDRIQRENEAIVRQIEMVGGDVTRYNSLINNKDDVDGQNNIMSQDLERMKNTNHDMNQNLKEEEIKTADTSNKLGLAAANVKSNEIDFDSMNHDLRQKNQRFDVISREKTMAIQKLSNVNGEIERLNREELNLNNENIDLDANVARLQQDRQGLLAKVERQTKTNDGTVRDLGYGKRNMDQDNSWHTKLIVTKNMHVALDMMVRRRRQVIFNELANYSIFDGKCHQKLKNLANTLEKVGRYKQQVGLHQWYDRALKPLGTKLQNNDLSIVLNCQRLTDRVFYAWKHYVYEKQEVYRHKSNSMERIWFRLVSDSRKEMKRAFDIWKQKKGFEKQALQVLRRVTKKRNDTKMEAAMYIWKRYSQELEYHCRTRILHKDFTRKVYLSHVFSEFKICVRIQKQGRHRMMNQFFKAWLDYNKYNRHLMQANMAAIAFRNSNTEFTIRCCFQSLKTHTETSKFTLLSHAVQEDMDVVIQNTDQFNRAKQAKLLNSNKLRAGNITRDAIGKRLFSYFHQWKVVTDHYNMTMDQKIKNKVLKVYLKKIDSYFVYWKKNIFDNHIRAKMRMVQELHQQSEQMTNDALQQEKLIRQTDAGSKSFQRRITEKVFKKCFYRRLQYAINRWKDQCVDKNNKQDRAEFVFKKLRKRLLQQAFDKYVYFQHKSQQHSKNLSRADHIQETLRLREMRKIYNAMCYYTQWKLRVKRIWHKVLSRFDYFQKQRGIKRWKNNAHGTFENNLKKKQHAITEFIQSQNEELNEFQLNGHGQHNVIKTQSNNLRRKGYRQIGNMFQRLYTEQTHNKFNVWKQKVLLQKQKERIMKRSIEHYQRRYLEAIHRVFLKFLSDDRKRERMEQIKHTEIENDELTHIIKVNKKKHEAVRSLNQNVSGETNCLNQDTERKIIHTMECMESKNLNWVYRSRKRMIFEMWRTVCKEEKALAYSVKNVMMKTLLQEGFTRIKQASRDIDFTQKVHRALIRFSLKGSRINSGDSFTKWKMFAFNKVNTATNETVQNLQNQDNEFQEFRDAAQNQNLQRVSNFFIEKNQANIFRAWKNVTKHFKLVKQKTKEFHTRQEKMQRVWAITKWRLRKDTTLQKKHQNELLITSFQQKYMRGCFREWKRHYNITRSLTNSLHHLEMTMRTKIFSDCFKNLKSYSTSKRMVTTSNNGKGCKKASQILHNIYLKIINKAFQKYKNTSTSSGESNQVFKSIYGKIGNKRIRDAFFWWKKKHTLAELADDMHDTGPVRAEHWLADKQIENLKQFMRDQHYTELEVDKFYNDTCGYNDYLMKKHMIRMRYRLDPIKRLLPIVMDRWKGFVQVRKNLKYQFKFLSNFAEVQKGEMQLAFNKWKKSSDKLEQELWRLDYKTLEQIGLRTTEQMQECSDQVGENQSINNHLVLQRDEFLNYYIKGQILAMALVKDRTTFAQMQGMSRWLIIYRKNYIKNQKQNIRDDEYLLANLEERELQLKNHNDEMEEENSEMEQFKADGIIIRENKHRLEGDVEVLVGHVEEFDEEIVKLKAMKFETMAAIRIEEEKIKENQQKGYAGQFQEAHKKAQLKSQPNKSASAMKDTEETAEEKAMREKMEQLAKLSKTGPSLR